MKIAFENRYVETVQMRAEYLMKSIWRSARVYTIAAIAALGVSFAFSLSRAEWFHAATSALGLFTLAGTGIVLPHLLAKRSINIERAARKGVACETVVRFGEEIELTEGTLSERIAYSRIVRFVRMKEVWVLVISKDDDITLKPDGFVVGSRDLFDAFLREKCPNLKR
jgi:hypothetical protein